MITKLFEDSTLKRYNRICHRHFNIHVQNGISLLGIMYICSGYAKWYFITFVKIFGIVCLMWHKIVQNSNSSKIYLKEWHTSNYCGFMSSKCQIAWIVCCFVWLLLERESTRHSNPFNFMTIMNFSNIIFLIAKIYKWLKKPYRPEWVRLSQWVMIFGRINVN
jgi:hypothetical protein